MSQPPTGDQEIITVNIYNHRLNYTSFTLRDNVRICWVIFSFNMWGSSLIRYWYSKHLTWVKTYQFDTYQVNNGSDPGCEEQWAMSWCQAGQDCHYDCILGPGRLWGGVSEWLFVQHIVGIPHTGHSSYLQITHPYITLSLSTSQHANHWSHFTTLHPSPKSYYHIHNKHKLHARNSMFALLFSLLV